MKTSAKNEILEVAARALFIATGGLARTWKNASKGVKAGFYTKANRILKVLSKKDFLKKNYEANT